MGLAVLVVAEIDGGAGIASKVDWISVRQLVSGSAERVESPGYAESTAPGMPVFLVAEFGAADGAAAASR